MRYPAVEAAELVAQLVAVQAEEVEPRTYFQAIQPQPQLAA